MLICAKDPPAEAGFLFQPDRSMAALFQVSVFRRGKFHRQSLSTSEMKGLFDSHAWRKVNLIGQSLASSAVSACSRVPETMISRTSCSSVFLM